MKLKSLHETGVMIPIPGSVDGLQFAPGQIREVDDELGKLTLMSKGWEEVKENEMIAKRTTKEVKQGQKEAKKAEKRIAKKEKVI